MKKTLSALIFLLMLVIAIPFVHGAPVKIRFSCGVPQNHFITNQFVEWAKLIEQNSKGEIKVEVYDSAQLYRDNEVIKAVQTGGLESGSAFTMYLGNQLIPGMKVFQFPFLFQTLDETIKVYQSEIGAAWKKTAEQKGVKIFSIVCYPSPDDTIILATKPIKMPTDLNGMIIRTVTPENAIVLKKFGAGASFLSGGEVYLGLQRGTINGSLNSIANYKERKLYEVAHYAIFLPLITTHGFISMNKAFFDGLSPQQQQIILDASEKTESKTTSIAKKVLKEDYEAVAKISKLYHPTPSELALWKDVSTSTWPDLMQNNQELAKLVKSVQTILNR